MVRRKVEIFGIEHGGVAHGALEDGRFEVVDHDFARNATKEIKGMLVASEEVFHGLGDGELDVQHATVAQDHDKKTQLAVRLAHRDRAEGPPIHLGTLAGGKGQREKGSLPPGAHRAHIGFDQLIATVKAVLAQALEDLRGRIGMAFQQTDNVRFERIEFASVRPGSARVKVFLGQPVGHRAAIQGDGLRDLRGVQAVVGLEVFDLAETMIIDHDNASQIRANTALMSTGSSSAATGEALLGASMGSVSRAKTW